MSDESRSKEDAAMADIAASIRRIVAEGDRAATPMLDRSNVLELTPNMRVANPVQRAAAGAAAAQAVVDPEIGALSVDEAAIIEIARAVVRDELEGQTGEALSQRIRALVREEVARALQK